MLLQYQTVVVARFLEQLWPQIMKHAPVGLKKVLLDRACRPTLTFRFSRWPPQPVIAKELDRVQTKMAGAILRTKRHRGEAVDAYVKRRNRAAAVFCRESGLWSKRWFKRSLAWDAHIRRGHNPYSWPTLLVDLHGEEWLEEQRMLTNYHGTQTRLSAGCPAMRWHEGIRFARPRLE